MRNIFVIIGMLLLSNFPILAQPLHGAFGYFAVGLPFLQLDHLNDRLTAHNIPTFDTPHITMGGGGGLISNNVLLGGEGASLVQRERTYQRGDTTFRIQLEGGMGNAFIGYTLLSAPVILQLSGGIGGGNIKVKITEERGGTFDEVLQHPQREIEMSVNNFLIQGSAHLLIPITRSLFIGAQGGYVFTLADKDWQYRSRIAIANGPKTGFDGPFIRLLIGFGWFNTDDDCDD